MEAEENYPMMQAMPNSHASETSLQYQIDANQILEELEHTLKGEVIIQNTETNTISWVTPQNIRPLINEDGINSVLMLLRSRLNKIFILSDFSEENIRNMVEALGQAIIDDFYLNWTTYKIKDQAAASYIQNLICDTYFATLRKGHEGNYLKFLRSTQSIHEIQNYNISQRNRTPSQEDGGGMLDFFKRRR